MLQLSRQGRVYAKLEAAYGVQETLAAANAIRHQSIDLPADKFNRETLMEKQTGAGQIAANRVDRRESAGFSLEAVLRAGGVVNTAPELDPFLQAAFGQTTSVVLATTVASGGTTTGATLTSAGGLAVGDPVLITCPDGKKRARFLTSVAGAVVAWTPALPAAPSNGAAVKGARRYHQTTTNTKSLTIAHYLVKSDLTAGLERQVIGAGVDKFTLSLDANAEPTASFSGDAKTFTDAQTKPGGFTTIGAAPPSGIVGEAMVGSTALLWLKAKIDIENGLWLRRDEAGVALASEMFRAKRRSVGLSLSTHVEDRSLLYDPGIAGTSQAVFFQIGFTEGNIIAVRIPLFEVKVPKTSDGDEVADWDFSGPANESADAANDAITLAIL